MLAQVLGGHITVATGGLNEFAGMIETGQLRALGISAPERIPGVDIPTFKELGYPDIVADVSFYMMAPKGTPQPIVDKLYRAADKAMENPKVRESFRVQGIEDRRGGPSELGAYIAAELQRWSEIVKLSAPPK